MTILRLTTNRDVATIALLFVASLMPLLQSSARAQDFGWTPLRGTVLTDICPDSGLFDYEYVAKCQNVVFAWSSGALDAESGNLYIWGGGHNDYYGNELYQLNVHSKTLVRLTEPAPPADPAAKPAQSELAPFDGTQPNSRHTYDGMSFMSSHGVLWAFSGALAGRALPILDDKTWLFYPGENAWRLDDTRGDIPSGSYGVVSAYDPNTGKVFLHNRQALYSYTFDPDGGAYERLNSKGSMGLGVNAAIDPKSRRMLIIGNGRQILYDLNPASGYRRISAPLKGDANFIKKHDAPGLAYNSNDGHFYAWPGDGKLYRFDMDSLTWEGLAFNDDPGPQGKHGTFGRFDYVPSIDSFVLLNSSRKNAYLFKLRTDADTRPPTPPSDLNASHPYSGALSLTWQASTDNFGVAGYRVFVDGEQVVESDRKQFKSMAYKPGETVSLQVQAFDSAGYESPLSVPLEVTLPKVSPRLGLGDCSSERGLSGRDDIVFCEPWDSENWWQKNDWLRDPIVNDPRPMTARTANYTRVIDEGCLSGKCLQVTMEEGKTKALSAYWPLTNANLAPERLFMRYYLKLGDNWNINSCKPNGNRVGAGGKFPGLADVRTWADRGGQCGNGGASGDGLNCWSMRLNYRDCRSNDGEACSSKPGAAMRLGSYLYYPLQSGSTGSVGHWDNDDWNQSRKGSCDGRASNLFCGKEDGGVLERGQWYQIEMQVEMNTPGRADGVIRGWVDGKLSYEKTNMVFRKKGHDFLHNRLAWFNIYKGGVDGNCQTSNVYLDQMVIALDKPVGGLDSVTPIPPQMLFTASSVEPDSDTSVQLQWSSQDASQCKAAGLWAGEKATKGWETLDSLTRSGTVGLECSGPGGKVVRQIDLLVDGKPLNGNAPVIALTTPTGLRIAERTSAYLKLAWDPSLEQDNVVAYRLMAGGIIKDELEGNTAIVRNLIPGTTLEYSVQAVDNNGNLSAPSESLDIGIPAQDASSNIVTLYPESDTFLASSTFKALGGSSRLSLDSDRRVLLKFPIEILSDYRQISSASVVLQLKEQFGDAVVEVYYVASNWNERTASRDYADNSSKRRWQQPLGDWVDAAGDVNGDEPLQRVQIPDTGAREEVIIDVTAMVNEWLDGQPNNGMILVRVEGKPQNFYSKDGGNADRWPQLQIRLRGG